MRVCTHKAELQARKRGFCKCKPAWSCYALLDPKREGEIWQEGSWQKAGCFSHLAGLPVVSERLPFRGKMKQKQFGAFQKLKEISSSPTPFHKTSLPYSDQPKQAKRCWLGHTSGTPKCQV